MSSRPLVTVAMPLYNGAAELESSLELIRSQTWRDLEIILCDDGSSDATPDICAAAAKADDRIRFVRNPKNLGMTANFNLGLTLKHGDFFMWAGQDDEKAPAFVEKSVAALLRNGAASLACTTTTIVSREGTIVHTPYSAAIASPKLEERVAAFVAETQTVAVYGLYRSSVLDAVGPMPPWLDTDRHYLFEVLIRGPFEVVMEPLFRYNLIHGADDYVAMGLGLRPGAIDFDLDLYHYLPQMLREAGVSPETIARCRAAMKGPLTPYLDRRAEYLIGRLLSAASSRMEKLWLLTGYARQYPPMLRSRMFWGAIRRVTAG